MRNLNQLYHIERSINATNIKRLLEHPEKAIFFFASSSEIFSFDDENGLQFLFAVPDIVDIEYLVLSNEICIATAAGEVLTFSLDSKTEEVRTCCDGILSMKFSPDQALSVFVTR
jgi:IKI3 family